MASKGMADLFARVQANPKDERLLNRVLSLISDIRNLPARASAALELASLLVEPLPREAMRLAHMVYRADRSSLLALEIVIACLRKLGRLAKAEILTIELRKLHGLQKIEGPPNVDRQVIMTPRGKKGSKKPPPPSIQDNDDHLTEAVDASLRRGVRSEFSVIAPIGDGRMAGGSANNIPGFSELDLKDFSQIAAIANAVPDEFVPDSMPWGGAKQDDFGIRDGFAPEPTSVDAVVAASMDRFDQSDNPEKLDSPDDIFNPPADSSVPVTPKEESPRGTIISMNLNPAESPLSQGRDIGFSGEERHTQISQFERPKDPASGRGGRLSGDENEDDSNDDMVAAAELFDYYWQQGFLKEARDLLNQTAAVCSEAHWWRARKNLLRSSQIGRLTGAGEGPKKGDVNPSRGAKTGKSDKAGSASDRSSRRVAAQAPAPVPIASFAGFDLSSLLNEPGTQEVQKDKAATASSEKLLQPGMTGGKEKDDLPQKPLVEGAFWPPLLTELASLTYKVESLRGLIFRSSGPNAKRSPSGPEVPPPPQMRPEVSGAIEALGTDGPIWEMVQALWGESPGQDCINFLQKRKLVRVNTGFWGCYLDALLATRQHRIALHEVRAVLRVQRQLNWATTAYSRLPMILDRLNVKAIHWDEADGVQALIDRVSKRQPPLARGLFVATQ